MSRNVRQKHPRTPVKSAKGRRRRVSETSESSLDLSDDSGYSAVDEISDSSDDDEEDVAAAEEENLLKEAQGATPTTPRPLYESNDDDDDDDDDEDQDGDDEGALADDDNDSWAGILSEMEGSPIDISLAQDGNLDSDAPTVERHVHFADSDSDSTDTDIEDHADIFPDLFVSQNSLDPTFRREIENDPDDSSGSGSFWDFNYHAYDDSDTEEANPTQMNPIEEFNRVLENLPPITQIASPIVSQTPTAASTPVAAFEEARELDGYETDGDTTEEDIPEPLVRRRTRRPSNPMSEVSNSDGETPVSTEQGQPRVSRVNLDRPRRDKKPKIMWNYRSNKMLVFTPNGRRGVDLSPERFDLPWAIEQQSSPIMSTPANLMISAMFSAGTFGDFVGSMGPAEAFFPGIDESETASSTHEEEEDDGEGQLNLDDFLKFGESSDEEDDMAAPDATTPRRPTTASSDADVLPQFNSNTVAAFRRNQIDQQLILSSQATQDSLAFSGPYNYTALKGLKSDRFDTAGVPLTPMRRTKSQRYADIIRSPLAGMSSKRKASGQGDNGHKRHRSISEVSHLKI